MADTIDLQAIDRGLGALTGLLLSADVRTTMALFRAAFLAASQLIDVLSDYIDLFNLLHDLEFRYYNYIASQAARFPGDELVLETLQDHALTFNQIVARLQEVAARPTVSEELAWIDELAKAEALLGQALEARDAAALKRWCRLVKRILDRYPSLINARVNAAARSLKMDAIEQGMATILTMLRNSVVASETLEALAAGRASLAELNQRLPSLVRDLDRWQDVDVELRRVEAVLTTDPEELELSWPGIKAQVLALLANEDETALRAESARLDDALAAKDTVRGQRYFIRFRRLAARQFYRVVAELKDLCNRLRILGAPLADVARLIVTSPPAATSPTPPPITPSPQVDGALPELQLLVTLAPDGKTLGYTLHSADGEYNHLALGSKTLQASPRELLQSTFDRLSSLARLSVVTRSANETRRANQELAAIGVQLYDQFFSDELKREYSRVLRKKYRGQSMLVTTADPWIPWELVTPQDPGEDEPWEEPTDPPLCEMFQLGRWLAGRGAPNSVYIQKGVWIAPPDNLQAAQVENDYLSGLHRRLWTISLSGPITTLSELEECFSNGDVQLFHFTIHTNFDTSNPNESRLKLGDRFLRPSQIVGPRLAGLRKSKPLVFLNACSGGQVGVGLMQLGGWVQRFIDAGASALIGAQWEISDSLAQQFVVAFYDRLFGLHGHEPMPLGQAFHEARQVIKEADPANPSWLAYVLYGDPGDPQARVVLSRRKARDKRGSEEAHALLTQINTDQPEHDQEQETGFRNELSAETLDRVLDKLMEAWAGLDPIVRQYIRAVIRSHGAQIADTESDQIGVTERISDLLKALWLVRAKLPDTVVQDLRAGQIASESADTDTSVPNNVRSALVEKMLVPAYENPKLLVEELDELIAANEDRLVEVERTAWRTLHEAFRQNEQTTPYLQGIEAWLVDYSKVRQTLKAHQIWELAPVFREEPSKTPIISPLRLPESTVIELRVELSAERSALAYTLHLPELGYDHRSCGQVVFGTASRAACQDTIDRLNSLVRMSATRTASETANAERGLADIGVHLYRDFFSPELREAYRELRETCIGCSLLIISDEAYITWELIRPVEVDANGTLIYEDPPLCETFQIARGFPGFPTVNALTVRKGVWTVLPANMREAISERDYFGQLSQHLPQLDLIGPVTRQRELEECLGNGESQLLHLATFSSFEPDSPSNSRLRLEDGFLQPSQLSGAIQAGLQRARPLVFMNSDNAARLGFDANGRPDGWASRFIAAGATAFAGLLTVGSVPLTGQFAKEFYDRLFGLKGREPVSLGQAFHEARMAIKAADPANPTWLSYVLYGDPNARITLASGEEESQAKDESRPAKPVITDITARLPRDPAGFTQRPDTDIKAIVINHTGVGPEVDAERVAQAQRARWPGIVGQYFITGDGQIQQTNPIDEVVGRDQSWIFNGINIYVAGNFDETIPNEAQLDALAQLVAWLQWKYKLTDDAILGVSEHIETRSPGLQWVQGQRWKDQLLSRVRAVPRALKDRAVLLYLAGNTGKVFDTPEGKKKLGPELTSESYKLLGTVTNALRKHDNWDQVPVLALMDTLEEAYLVECRPGVGMANSKVWKLKPLNTADPRTLTDFVVHGWEHYPAKNVMLLVYGAGGIMSSDPYAKVAKREASNSLLSVVVVNDSNTDVMDVRELCSALQEAAKFTGVQCIDIIGVDLASVELAFELQGVATYLIAEQSPVVIESWLNGDILGALLDQPFMPADELSRLCVRSVRQAESSQRPQERILFAFHLPSIERFGQALGEWAAAVTLNHSAWTLLQQVRSDAIFPEGKDFVDLAILLGRFVSLYEEAPEADSSLLARAQDLCHALEPGAGPVLAHTYMDDLAATGKHGPPAYFPRRRENALPLDQSLAFAQTGWANLVRCALEPESDAAGQEMKPQTTIDNPFLRLGGLDEPAHFFGRLRELEQITNLLQQGQSISLVGPFGSGKSSVLAYLRHTARKWFDGDPRRVVYLDCQGLTSPQDFYAELCRLLGKPGTTGQEARAVLQDVATALLIDEFEALNNWPITQAHELAGWLRSVLQQGRTAAVIATQRPLAEVTHQQNMPGSSLRNILSVVTLDPLSADEAHDLLTARLAGTQITFSEAGITKLYQESQGLPRELMRLAAELYSQKIGAGQRPPESKPAVWLYMATGDDPVQLDLLARKDQVTWGANPNTRTGDLVVIYRTAPHSDIAYLLRASEDAHPTKRTKEWKWDHAIRLGEKVTLERPLSLDEVRAHSGLAEWSLVKANMQGAMRRRQDIRTEGYWQTLSGLLVARNPFLAGVLATWEGASQVDMFVRGLEAVLNCSDPTSAGLEEVVQSLVSAGQDNRVLEIAGTDPVTVWGVKAISLAAGYLVEAQRGSAAREAAKRAVVSARSIEAGTVRDDAFKYAFKVLITSGEYDLAKQVLAEFSDVTLAVYSASLLCTSLAQIDRRDEAIAIVEKAALQTESIEDPKERTDVRRRVVEVFVTIGERERALAFAHTLNAPEDRTLALGHVALELAKIGEAEGSQAILQEALLSANSIESTETRAMVSTELETTQRELTRVRPDAKLDFNYLILEKTRDFVGRDWVFAEIDAWLASPSASAFFLVMGAPGIGKTAILAKLTQIREVAAAHFCLASRIQTLDPSVFIRSITSQLTGVEALTRRPVTEIRRQLVDVLLRLPITETFDGRSSLLLGVSSASIQRSASTARLDLTNIVIWLSQLGPLGYQGSTPPLLVFVDNALSYAAGFEIESALIQIRRELESWYRQETQPTRSSSLPAQEAFARDVLSPLKELYAGGYDRQLVIAVDALDDALGWQGDETIVDLLAGSAGLPPQVRFVLTSRPDARVLSRLEQIGVARLDLDSHASENAADVRAYLEQGAKGPAVKEALAQANIQIGEFIERVAATSQGNFQAACQTLADVAAGKLNVSEFMGKKARPWQDRLSTAAKAALVWAETWYRAARAEEVYTEYLLAGLYEQPDGPARRLLTLFEEDAGVRPALAQLANMMTGTELRLEEVQAAPTQTLVGLAFSKNLNRAVDHAVRIADQAGEDEISHLRLLAGLQAATQSVAASWVSERLKIDSEILARLLAEAPGNELPVEAIRKASHRQKVSSRQEALARIELLQTDLLALSVDAIVHATSPALDFSGAIGGKIAQKLGEGFLNRVQGMPKPELGGALITDADSLPAHHIIHTPIRQANHPSTPETVAQGVVAALSAAASMEDIQTVAFSAMGATSGLNHAQVAPLVLEAAVGYLEQNARPARVLFALETSDTQDVYLTALEAMQPGEALTVPITAWYLSGAGVSRLNAMVGQPLELAVQLTPQPRDQSIPFQIPSTTRHVTFYVEAPGFHLDSEDRQTVSLVQDPPTERTLTVALRPLIDGDQKVTIAAYSGVRLEGLRPAELVIPISVARADVLPPIPELIEPRAIPEPQPDIVLYVALEGSPSKRHVQIYVTCPALGKERQRLDPLPLTGKNAEEVRLAAIRAAAGAGVASLPDATAALHAFGATLFDLLLPRGHVLRELYFKGLRRLLGASLLIVSDEDVVLPWEMVCAYYFEENRPGMQFDDFWGRQFVVTHWVGRKGRPLASEAPLGQIDLTHYQQYEEAIPRRWQAVMGGDQVVSLETGAGHLALMRPGSPYYGLHILQFADQRGHGRITRARETEAAARQDGEARELLYRRRLDFTLRRPVVGLSFVHGNTPGAEASLGSRDTRLERGWMLPMMHAGATAIVGPRWYTSSEADQTFYGAFYAALRTGMTVGWATWIARQQTRLAFPNRPDWLAYTCFGHPNCAPYLVRPSEGFVSFEELDHAADTPLLAGRMYSFLASYRTEAPEWFGGRLWAPQEFSQDEAVSAIVVALTGQVSGPDLAKLLPLQQTMPGGDFERVFELTMPNETTTEPVLIRFQRGGQELGTVMLNLDIVKGA